MATIDLDVLTDGGSMAFSDFKNVAEAPKRYGVRWMSGWVESYFLSQVDRIVGKRMQAVMVV